MSFLKSKKIGDIAEKFVEKRLAQFGSVSYNGNSDHDIRVSGQHNFTVEVKHDLYANKSGNIAVEFHNSRLDKPSGIYASKANFWVFYLNHEEVYLVPLAKLIEYVESNKPHKTIMSGGDNNANLYLYKKDKIMEIFTNMATTENLNSIIGNI